MQACPALPLRPHCRAVSSCAQHRRDVPVEQGRRSPGHVGRPGAAVLCSLAGRAGAVQPAEEQGPGRPQCGLESPKGAGSHGGRGRGGTGKGEIPLHVRMDCEVLRHGYRLPREAVDALSLECSRPHWTGP